MLHRLTGRPRRRRSPFWPLTAVAAIAAGLLTFGVVSRAEQASDDFGPRARVAVAAHDLDVGREITADDVIWRDLPAVLLPQDPLAEPVGRVLVSSVLAGEPLASARVGPEGLRGASALVGADQRALVISVPDAPESLDVGDAVDLLSADSIGSGEASWVARNATIVGLGETSVTVAVDRADAPAAARAALDGTVVVALIGAR